MNRFIAILKLLTRKNFILVTTKHEAEQERHKSQVLLHSEQGKIPYLLDAIIATAKEEGYKDVLRGILKEQGVFINE